MKYTKYIIPTILMLALITVTGVKFVKANPSIFNQTAQTATATTTVVWANADAANGQGTTTLVYDSYQSASTALNTKANYAAIMTQFAGSSTVSRINFEVEYSNGYTGTGNVNCVDTPLACDWYKDSTLDPNSRSTTTPKADITTSNFFSWLFSSSTPGGLAVTAANGATSTRVVLVPVPTRYMRVIWYVSHIANGDGAFWGQIQPSRERAE